jgi:hypothetical protein
MGSRGDFDEPSMTAGEDLPGGEPDPAPQPAPQPPPMTGDPPDPPPSNLRQLEPAERAQVMELLRQGQQALGTYDFDANKTHLDEAQRLAANSPELAMVDRQRDLARLTQRFQTLLMEQLRRQPPGTTYTLSATTQFILVEASDEQIVVRVQGVNKRYSTRPLQRGVGLALAEGILDETPGSQVLKGAFLASHPDRDEQDEQQAAEFWRQAEAAGIDLHDLPQVLTDKYAE